MSLHLFKSFNVCSFLLLLSQVGNGQIPPMSFDFGADGFYNSSPLTISRGGNAINGFTRDFRINGSLGFFIFENAAVGLNFRSSYEYFELSNRR